jgi:chlorite dismutase
MQPSDEKVGWPVLHQFYRIDRGRWRSMDEAARRTALDEFSAALVECRGEEGMQFVPLAGVAKSDFGIMAVHPELRRIQRLGQQIAATALGSCLQPVYDFLSMSEVSEYMSGPSEWAAELIKGQGLAPDSPEFAQGMERMRQRMDKYAEARVHPQLPTDMDVVCFYPMAKRRGETHNWYTLDITERRRLMGDHAKTGRTFAGRVLQLITTCTGLDDWEWGVTLFARDLKSIRDVVYEMRFDPASAIYGEFGEFYVGLRIDPADLADTLQLS